MPRSRGTGPRATKKKRRFLTVGRGPVPRHAAIAGDRPPRYGRCGVCSSPLWGRIWRACAVRDLAIPDYRGGVSPCFIRTAPVRDLAIPNYRVGLRSRGTGPRATVVVACAHHRCGAGSPEPAPFGIWRSRTTEVGRPPRYGRCGVCSSASLSGARAFAGDRPPRYGSCC